MSTPSTHRGNHEFTGTVTFRGAAHLPAGAVGDAQVQHDPLAPIAAEKVEREFSFGKSTQVGAAVEGFSEIVHIPRNAGELVAVEIAVETAPTGDNTITIDVEKWTGTAWSSLLAAAEGVDAAYVANTPVAVTLAEAHSFADGELIRITGAISGSTGTHAEGLRVQVTAREKP